MYGPWANRNSFVWWGMAERIAPRPGIIFELVKAFTIEVFVELHKHRNEEHKEFQALREVGGTHWMGRNSTAIDSYWKKWIEMEVSYNWYPMVPHGIPDHDESRPWRRWRMKWNREGKPCIIAWLETWVFIRRSSKLWKKWNMRSMKHLKMVILILIMPIMPMAMKVARSMLTVAMAIRIS